MGIRLNNPKSTQELFALGAGPGQAVAAMAQQQSQQNMALTRLAESIEDRRRAAERRAQLFDLTKQRMIQDKDLARIKADSEKSINALRIKKIEADTALSMSRKDNEARMVEAQADILNATTEQAKLDAQERMQREVQAHEKNMLNMGKESKMLDFNLKKQEDERDIKTLERLSTMMGGFSPASLTMFPAMATLAGVPLDTTSQYMMKSLGSQVTGSNSAGQGNVPGTPGTAFQGATPDQVLQSAFDQIVGVAQDASGKTLWSNTLDVAEPLGQYGTNTLDPAAHLSRNIREHVDVISQQLPFLSPKQQDAILNDDRWLTILDLRNKLEGQRKEKGGLDQADVIEQIQSSVSEVGKQQLKKPGLIKQGLAFGPQLVGELAQTAYRGGTSNVPANITDIFPPSMQDLSTRLQRSRQTYGTRQQIQQKGQEAVKARALDLLEKFSPSTSSSSGQ